MTEQERRHRMLEIIQEAEELLAENRATIDRVLALLERAQSRLEAPR